MDIPLEFYRDLCNDADHPMASCDTSNRFIWVNAAFEELVGYSGTELCERTWMDITKASDVGADFRAVQELLAGRRFDYRMEKTYIHKRGQFIPIILTVRRFPVNHAVPVECFRVEASLQRAMKQEIDGHLEAIDKRLETNTRRLEKMEAENKQGSTVNVGDSWHDGNKAGRDSTINSDKAIKFIAGAIVVMAIAVAWLFYYVAVTLNQSGNVQTPKIEVVK